jgi:hypothetical protein
MNKLWMIWVCVCLANTSQGQSEQVGPAAPSHKSCELGLNLYSLLVYPEADYGYTAQPLWEHNFGPSVYFRYGKKRTLLRSSLCYLHSSYSINNYGWYYYDQYQNEMHGAGFSIGSQRFLCDGAIQPYFSLDLGYTYTRQKGSMNLANGFDIMQPQYHSFTVAKHLVTFDPAFGVRWKLKDGLVFSLETGLGLYDLFVHDVNSNMDYEPEFRFRYKPVQQLSVGYRF